MISSCCHSNYFIKYNKDFIVCINDNCYNYLSQAKPIKRHHILIWVILLLLLIPYQLGKSHVLFFINFNEKQIQFIPLSEDNLQNEIKKNGILCAEVVIAQHQIESAYLTSNLLRKTNGMFGMRYPYKRSTVAIGLYIPALDTVILGTQKEFIKYRSYFTYAVYSNWQDAVKDYKLWQDHFFKPQEYYLQFLKNIYAEDSTYINKIESLLCKK